MPRPSSSYVSTASLQTHTMATGARSPPWTPPGSGELSREGSLAFSSGLPHPHSAVPRRAEAYFSILKEWRRPQALRQQPALPVTAPRQGVRESLHLLGAGGRRSLQLERRAGHPLRGREPQVLG